MPWTDYQTRFLTPAYLERDRATPLSLGVYTAGALAAPSSGTISIYDDSNTAVVSAAAVTVSGSMATYTLASATVSSKALGAGWRVEWSLVMPDTYTHVFRQDAALVRVRLAPVVTDTDLLERHTDLTSLRPSSQTSYEGYVLSAWRDIVGRLEGNGRRPYLIISPEALRPVHLYLTLSIIFRDFSVTVGDGSKFEALADRYEKMYQDAWAALSFTYDENDEGVGSANKKTPAQATVWLNGRGARNSFGRLGY